MRDIHTIRLRGPWQVQAKDGEAITVKMPVGWADIRKHAPSEKLRLTRHFNTPTGLEDLEQVWIVVESPGQQATVLLNGDSLGELQSNDPAFRREITPLLKERNKLEILIAPGDSEAKEGPVGEVRLEIGFP